MAAFYCQLCWSKNWNSCHDDFKVWSVIFLLIFLKSHSINIRRLELELETLTLCFIPTNLDRRILYWQLLKVDSRKDDAIGQTTSSLYDFLKLYTENFCTRKLCLLRPVVLFTNTRDNHSNTQRLHWCCTVTTLAQFREKNHWLWAFLVVNLFI